MPRGIEQIFTKGDYAEFRGQPQVIARMKLQQALRNMTPEERAAYDKQKAAAALADRQSKALQSAFKYTKTETITKDKTNPNIEKARALSLDDSNPDQWLLFFRHFPVPFSGITNFTRMRFVWGPDGKPRFVPMTLQTWRHYFIHPQRGRWVKNSPFMHKCSDAWGESHAKDKFKYDADSARRNPNTIPAHVRAWNPKDFICRKKKKSLWVKIRKPLAIVAGVVAAVYLGPIVLDKIGAIAGGSGGGAAGAGAAGGTTAGSAAGAAAGTAADAAAKASFFSKVKAGSTKILSLVNKARTVEAVVKGELPPPPIGIPGASFREWALIVAKEKIKEEAIDYAAEKGMEYVAKKMSEKEEAKLKAEIAAMQAELIRLTPKEVLDAPPEPSPELATPLKKVQVIEVERKSKLDQFIIPGAIVAGAMILGG